MATLDPAVLAQLLQTYGQQGLGGNSQIGGQYYSPMGVQTVDEGGVNNTLQGFANYDPSHLAPGDSYQYFSPSGQDAGTRQWQNGNDYKMALMALAAAGGMAAFLPGIAGAGATIGAEGLGAAGAGSGLGGAGTLTALPGASYTTLPDGTIMSTEADLAPASEGAANSTYALSGNAGQGLSLGNSGLGLNANVGSGLSMTAPSGGLGFNAATAGGAIGAGLGTTGLAAGTGTLLGPAALNGTYTMADGTILPGAGASTGSGVMDWLKGNGSWLAPILGSVLGSQPQKRTETTSKEPWGPLVPYLTGQGGLFDSAQNLAKSQMADQSGWNQMKALGQSMMNAPAGNGFSMFANNKVSNPVANWTPSGSFSNPFINWARPGFAQ